jgi:hypothetical protein
MNAFKFYFNMSNKLEGHVTSIKKEKCCNDVVRISNKTETKKEIIPYVGVGKFLLKSN